VKITLKKPVGLPLVSEKLTNPIKKVVLVQSIRNRYPEASALV
jgi:hypothetical protein